MFRGTGGFQEGGGDQFAHSEAACDPEVSGEVVGDRDAANNDSANGADTFGYFDGHHPAQGKSDEDKGFGGVELAGEAEGVVRQFLVHHGIDPVYIGRGIPFGKADMGKKAIVSPYAWDEIDFQATVVKVTSIYA